MWTIFFKVTEFVTILLVFYVFGVLTTRDVGYSSPTRDGTHACPGSKVLTAGPPGKLLTTNHRQSLNR